MNDLNKIPQYRVVKKIFHTEVLDDQGNVIERWSFTRDIKMYLSGKWSIFLMNLKCKIAKKLLKDVADPCPYCKKMIWLSEWKKFDE